MTILRILLSILALQLVTGLSAQGISDEARRRKLSYYYMAAQKAKAQEDYAVMMEMLSHCRDIMPDDPATTFELGHYSFPLGMDSLGTAMIEQAAAADPGNPWYQERLASIYLENKQQDKALEVLERMSVMQSKRVDVLSQLFMLYKQMGRTEDVIKTLDRIQTLQGNSMQIAEQKYKLYSDMGRTDEALEQIRAVCREFPYDLRCHIVMADHYIDNEMLDSALVCMERAERLDPHFGGLQMMKLQYILATGDTVAYEHLRDSLILDPGTDMQERFLSLREVALNALQDSLRRGHAQQIFQTLLEAEDVDVSFLQLYKSYDEFLHQDSAGYTNLELLKRIVATDPSGFESQMELVQYYIDQEDGASLREQCRNALVYFPSESRFHYYLALTYLEDHMKAEAEETLKAGIRQADENTLEGFIGVLYDLLGDLYHEEGREREAFAA